MKKVLIITYYWPPAGGTSVQRCLRFVKYLRNYGWEPMVYTADNPNYALYDEALIREIPEGIETIKYKIYEPNNFFPRAVKSGKPQNGKVLDNLEGKKRLVTKILWFIRGNFFIPDARALWVKPSVRYLKKVLSARKVDLIFSSGPPHSMHLIAQRLSKDLHIPWVADFRDPWTTMDYLGEMFLSPWAKRKHERLERMVIENASAVTVVGRTMYNEFKDRYNRDSAVIYNSYNETEGFKSAAPLSEIYPPDKKFTVVHVGSFKNNRNCDDLWETLAEMVKKDSNFAARLEIKLIGSVASDVLASIERYKLGANLKKIDFIPYRETIAHLCSAQALLLPIDRIPNSEFVLTGKLFDYLKAQRPILLIGPEKGDAAYVIQNCHAGYCCNFGDKEKMKSTVKMLYQLYLEGRNTIRSVNVEQYSASELTKQLAALFDTLTPEKRTEL